MMGVTLRARPWRPSPVALGFVLGASILVGVSNPGLASAAPRLTLVLNDTSFSAGDQFALSLRHAAGQPESDNTGDLYVAVRIPNQSLYVFDGTSFLLLWDGATLFMDALRPWRAGVTLTQGLEPVLSTTLGQDPGLRHI